MSDETEMTLFGDEPEQPKQPATSNGNGQVVNNVNQSANGGDGYSVVERDEGEGKSNLGQVVVETATKGLLYRCEVFANGALIDAKEINCKDLLSNESKDFVFKQRYLATHNTFKLQYMAEEFFKEVESDEGDFQDGEEHCKVVTFVSEDTIRTVVYLDGEEFESKELAIADNIKNKKNLIEKKYQVFHLDNVERYIDKEKFPVNTFLNPLLEKLPFYKKNPMYAFYFFIGIILVILLAIKMFFCSDFMVNKKKGKKKFEYLTTYAPYCDDFKEKIVKGCNASFEGDWKLKSKVFTTKTCKSACVDYDFIDGATCDKWTQSIGLVDGGIKTNPFTITPEGELELSQKKITTVYLKNNTPRTLRFKVVGRKIIDNPNSEIIMFINDKTEVSLEPNEENKFEIRLESTYIGSFSSGEYKGEILFAVYNDDKSINTTEKRNFKFAID